MKIKEIYFQDGSKFIVPENGPVVEIVTDCQPIPGFVAIQMGNDCNFHRADQIKLIVAEGN